MARPPIPFQVVSLDQVPAKPPVKDAPSHQTGSQWDPALKALRENPDSAVRISELDKDKRGKMRSTATIMAHNREMMVEVRDAIDCFYIFLSERDGRYHRPK